MGMARINIANENDTRNSYAWMINPVYKTKDVVNYIQDLWSNYGIKKYSHVNNEHKRELAGLLMLCVKDTEDEGNAIFECEDLSYVIKMIRSSLVSKVFDENRLVESIKDNVVSYYDNLMEAMFNQYIEELFDEC